LVIRTQDANTLYLRTNDVDRLTIASSGAATFSSSVTASILYARAANYPQIVFQETTSSTDSLIFYDNVSATKQLGFRVNSGSNVMTLTSTNVGIGTTSPSAFLDISSGTSTDIFRFGASSRWGFRRENNDNRYVSFYRGLSSTPSAVWTVDGDNGNVGIGTTSPTGTKLDIRDDSANSIRWGSTSTQYGFTSWDTNLAIIGSVGASTSIGFWTNGTTERMRITSGGNVLIGTTTDSGYKLQVNGSASVGVLVSTSDSTEQFIIRTSSDTNKQFIFGRTSTYASIFAVTQNVGYVPIALQQYGGNVLIGTTTDAGYKLNVNGNIQATGFFESSDKRLKDILFNKDSENFGAISFNWKDKRDSKLHWGYVAQEVEKFLPDAIIKGNDGFLSIDYNQAHTFKIAMIEDEVTILKRRVKELETQLNLG
jgi:hypothetical protein